MTSPLNDLSRQTRWMVVAQAGGAALLLASPRLLDDSIPAFLACVAVGVSGMLGAPIWLSVWSRGVNGRLLDRLEAASAEIVSGRVVPVRARGRAVRSRVETGRRAYVGSGPLPRHHPSRAIVATALAPGGPRRSVALVPGDLQVTRRGTPLALLLHPDDPDLAVLDLDTDAAALAAGDADPRWSAGRLPSDGSVIGGWPLITLVAVLAVSGAVGGVLLLELLLG